MQVLHCPLKDLNTSNLISPRLSLVCDLHSLRRFHDLHLLLENVSRVGNALPTYFIPTPKVPLAMQSPMQIFRFERIDANSADVEIGFGFKLRNPSVRSDYRDEGLPAWWSKAIEHAAPEVRTAILLYADVLTFYDALFTSGTLTTHDDAMRPTARQGLFALALSAILKKHGCFESAAPVFSMEAKKAFVERPDGHKLNCCARCNTADAPLLVCGKCKTARYCGRDCQKAHWGEHRPLCQAIREEARLGGSAPKFLPALHTRESILEQVMVEGPRGELLWEQLHDLFAHTCWQCYGWLRDPWAQDGGFCSRGCRRRFHGN